MLMIFGFPQPDSDCFFITSLLEVKSSPTLRSSEAVRGERRYPTKAVTALRGCFLCRSQCRQYLMGDKQALFFHASLSC